MESIIEVGLLLSAYGSLLTENQEDLMEAYYFNDLSLQEIADNAGISKQAVSDQLHRARTKLRTMEDEVHHVEMVLACQRFFDDLDQVMEKFKAEDRARLQALTQDLKKILSRDGKEGRLTDV